MNMKNKIKELRARRLERKLTKAEAAERMPRITNETVASHREEILSGARKYIYPLQHSKHKVVIITSSLFVTAVLAFATYCVVSLYKLQSTSTFLYRVTQVLPFPVAKSGGTYIAYENYLFELRHYMHYYETQQKLSFKTDSGRQQLNSYKQRALDKVSNDASIKQIAREKSITVSDAEIDTQISRSRALNRLGGSDRVFEDVIREYYGWTLSDFKRSLRTQLLEQKVNAALDTDAQNKVATVDASLKANMSFADVAKQYSDDEATKQLGGEFGILDKANTTVSPQTIDTLFKLQPGQVSGPVIISYDTGYALEIIKSLEITGNKAKGAHIVIRLKDINAFLNDNTEKHPNRRYIKLAK